MLSPVARPAAIALAVALALCALPPARAETLTITPVLTGLAWPVALAFAPDGRWFLNERLTGAIRVVAGGQLQAQVWATVPVLTAGEQGLLGLAIDPRWVQGERWVYVYHTYANGTTPVNRIARFFDTSGQATVLEVVLDGIPAAGFHNGGILGFGPDGMLYATTGDATNMNNAQDLGSLGGKVLRMNGDGSVPADNPFVATPGANPRVFTYGHRNIFGLAFRPVTGQPFITENGPSSDDEVNALVAGGNYGWPNVLGVAGDPRYRDPILVFQQIIAPTGAAFFTGSQVENLSGDLVFGDWGRGALNRIRFAGPTSDAVAFNDRPATSPEGGGGVLDVDSGPDGFLYFTTRSAIYRVNGTAQPGGGPSGVSTWLLALALIVIAASVVLVILVARDRRRRRTAK